MYKIISRIFLIFFPNLVVKRKLNNFDKVIYFEMSKHLGLFFSRKVDYEFTIWENISVHISPNDLVFDIGGNIGQYLLKFSEVVGHHGKVISFEPDYRNFSFLEFNRLINKCHNAECILSGISNESLNMTFYRDTKTGGRMGSFLMEYVSDKFEGFIESVPTMTYDSIVEVYGVPNFVKIDVEGFEDVLLKGMSKIDEKTIFLVEVREKTKKAVFDFFHEKNFICFLVDDKKTLVDEEKLIPNFANLLFLK